MSLSEVQLRSCCPNLAKQQLEAFTCCCLPDTHHLLTALDYACVLLVQRRLPDLDHLAGLPRSIHPAAGAGHGPVTEAERDGRLWRRVDRHADVADHQRRVTPAQGDALYGSCSDACCSQ